MKCDQGWALKLESSPSWTMKIWIKTSLYENEKAGKYKNPVAEFKEFERRVKFKPRFQYGLFHLKLYQMFQDLSLRLI